LDPRLEFRRTFLPPPARLTPTTQQLHAMQKNTDVALLMHCCLSHYQGGFKACLDEFSNLHMVVYEAEVEAEAEEEAEEEIDLSKVGIRNIKSSKRNSENSSNPNSETELDNANDANANNEKVSTVSLAMMMSMSKAKAKSTNARGHFPVSARSCSSLSSTYNFASYEKAGGRELPQLEVVRRPQTRTEIVDQSGGKRVRQSMLDNDVDVDGSSSGNSEVEVKGFAAPATTVPIRQYYHSRSMLPMKGDEMEHDSDCEDLEESRLINNINANAIDEFDDVDEKEKSFFKMWNAFAARTVGERAASELSHPLLTYLLTQTRCSRCRQKCCGHM